MKDKILTVLKKTILFVLVAGVSCVALSVAADATGLLGADGFLGTIVTFSPVVIPIVLGTMAAKRLDPKESGSDKPASKRKPFYKRWWVWVIVVILVLGSCDTEPIELENTETTVTTAPEETVSIDTAMSMIDDMLQLTFENYTIEQDNRTIRVSVWRDGVSDGVLLAQTGNVDCIIAWNDFIESQKDCCASMYKLVQALGDSDISVELNVLNDRNKANILLSTVNGVIVYDCLKD